MNKLKQVLRKQGRSQKWFAEKMNKTENTISIWVLNKNQPSVDDLYKAAGILQVEIAELLMSKEEIDFEKQNS